MANGQYAPKIYYQKYGVASNRPMILLARPQLCASVVHPECETILVACNGDIVAMKTWLWITALLIWLCGATGPLQAQTVAPPDTSYEPTLNLWAQGELDADPDLATLRLGISTIESTAASALAENAEKMARVNSVLKSRGIAPRDIRTSSFNLSAQFAYEPNKAPRLTGYEARHEIAIIIRDLPTVGSDLDAAISAGANEMNGIDFGLSHPKASEDSARIQAFKALTAKAELYRDAMGYRKLRLIALAEAPASSGTISGPMPRMTLASQTAPTTVPAPGQLKVHITLSAQYVISP